MQIPVLCTVTRSFENPVTVGFNIEVPSTFNSLGLADRQMVANTAIIFELLHTQDFLADTIGAIVATKVGGFSDMVAPFRPQPTWLFN